MKLNEMRFLVPAGMVFVVVIFMLVMATQVMPRILVGLIKTHSFSKPSLINSYVLVDKQVALADGIDLTVVNVFLLDENKLPVAGSQVRLSGLVKIESIGSGVSDNNGKVSFKLRSDKEGQFEIEALVNGSPLSRTVKVIYRN